MRPAQDSRPVTCPYGKKGSSWATGEHGGIDYGCPVGDPVYAMWGGTVTGVRTSSISGTTWGSAYGYQVVIDHDKLPDGSAGLWAVYAHMSSVSVKVGQRVEAGQQLGKSGNTGNVSGPHLHVEVQKAKAWKQGNYVNPQPWVDAGGKSSSGGPYVTKNIYTNKLGYGEPTNGDTFSDTVKELQERLNRISLPSGATLKVNGVYDDPTDAEVRKWQSYIGNAPDQPKKSYLGPKQTAAMFPSSTYTIHDTGLPAIANSSGQKSTLGEYLKSKGFKVEESNVPLGRTTTWTGVQFLMVHHTASPESNTAASDAAWIRHGNADAPLAQLMLDQTGMVWICCRERDGQKDPGRASHAGSGSGFGVPKDQMNEVSLGIECKADGTKPLSAYPTMYSTLIRLLAVLRTKYSVPSANVIGHKEWSSTGKKDPLDNMNVIRSDVDKELGTTPPTPEPEPGMQFYDYTGKPSGTLTISAGEYKALDAKTKAPTASGLEFHMLYVNATCTWKSGGDDDGVIRVKYVRDAFNGQPADDTGYQDYSVPKGSAIGDPDTWLITATHWEAGEKGRAGRWYIRAGGGLSSIKLGTRYAKVAVV